MECRRVAWYRAEAVPVGSLLLISNEYTANYACDRRQDVTGVLRCSACVRRTLTGRIICCLCRARVAAQAILSDLSVVCLNFTVNRLSLV